MSGHSDSQGRLLVLWSAHAGRSRSERERWAREQLPVLRSAPGVHEVWLRRVSPTSPRRGLDWDWAFELCVSHEAVAELCDRGACGDLLADMRLLGMRPVAILLDSQID